MAGVYIHIPFCKQACHYCDFHFSTSLKSKDDLLNALLKEIALEENFFAPDFFPGDESRLQTIYFGGGTPSLLSGTEIKTLLEKIRNHFPVAGDAEVTLEANPDDLTMEKLRSLYDAGVNRLSIGIQGFVNEDLKWMHRAHSSEEAIQSVKDAQEAGFKNITIDLIYGTPLLTNEQWKKNLQTAFDLDVQHLSCYALTVEPRTALAHSIKEKKQPPVDESKQAAQFEILLDMTERHGFEQYEISNFARDQYYSKHNSSYWSGEKYLGIGPSAHSFNGVIRQWNVRNNQQYIRAISEGKIPSEKETLTTQNKFNEYVMTSLRTVWGCSVEKMRTDFGTTLTENFVAQAMDKVSEGLLVRQKQHFMLSRKGKFFADRIASELFIL